MNMSLRQLRYVVAAADCGHVTAAAKRLNVSQPSVSSAIAEVEAEIGVPLFMRHHARGVTLTPVGERIVNEARLLLKHASDFGQNAVELGGALKGEIVVGCFLTLAIRFLPGLLARFAQILPGHFGRAAGRRSGGTDRQAARRPHRARARLLVRGAG